MKRVFVLLTLLVVSSGLMAGYDISFSTDDGGSWSYEGSSQTFSFNQPIGVDRVQGVGTDGLVGMTVEIPDFVLSNVISPVAGFIQGDITPANPSEIIIRNGDTVVLRGNLGAGTLAAFGTTAGMYPQVQFDIVLTEVNSSAINSAYLNTLNRGDVFDFSVSLQSEIVFAEMIQGGIDVCGDTFSGGMSMVPEPATLVILGLGSVLLRKRRIS